MSTDERRLLELLAGSEDGSTDALLVAHGFDSDLMARLVRERLATATSQARFCRRQAGRGDASADHGRGAPGAGREAISGTPL
jgi:hypothetical protein